MMKKIFYALLLPLLSTLIFLHTSLAGPEDISVQTSLPSLEILEQAAMRWAGFETSKIRQWQKNSRWAAALPRIQIGYEQTSNSQNNTVIQDNVSVTSSGVNIGPESNRIDQDFDQDYGLEVKAIWALDEIIFNSDELSVSREARDLLLSRMRLSQELQQIYYELKTHLLKLQMDPSLQTDLLEKIKTEQLIDKINCLTGGEFKRLWR